MGKRVGVYRVLVRRPEGKRPLGRPIHRREDNIKMGHQEMGCRSMDWINVVWYRDKWRAFVNAIMNFLLLLLLLLLLLPVALRPF
jgi:hypothetical protein